MTSKVRSLALILLMMLFSGVAHSEEVTGVYGKSVQDGTTVNGIYYGKGYEVNIGNLFIGGIGQRSQNADGNDERYRSFSDDNSAIYVPTYYMGVDGQSREFNFIQDGLQVDYAAQGIRTPANGLASPALNDKQYDTVIGYSGGTTAVVTAMALQNVKANKLILISPMRGGLDNVGQAYLESMGLGEEVVDEFDWNFDWQREFEQKIQTILNAGTQIEVIQSEQDELPLGSDFQYKFSQNPRITVHNVALTNEGIDAHSEIFFEHAMNCIKNGIYDAPEVQSFKVTPLSVASGEFFTIEYSVLDINGPGLKQVELWRKDERSDWQEVKRNELSGERGPTTGSFMDSPSASGKNWYGLHVVDNAGNWNDEKNYNSKRPLFVFVPIEVEVNSAQKADRSLGLGMQNTWNKSFGGPKSDSGNSVDQTSDEGYIIVGFTESFGAGDRDVWLVKVDGDGNKLWDKTFGGPGTDSGSSVQQTSDDGYIILANSEDGGAWLIKTDSNGDKLWDKTFGDDKEGFSIQQTNDDGYIITGQIEEVSDDWTDIFLIKTDSNGNILWDKTFDGEQGYGYDGGHSVRQTSDSGYIITGIRGCKRGSGSSGDVWLIKTDSIGNIIWDKTFPQKALAGEATAIASGYYFSDGDSVQQTSDGGYIIAGVSGSALLLIKTDNIGNIVWDETLGGYIYGSDNILEQTSDGGYVITGLKGIQEVTQEESIDLYCAWLVKTNGNGNVIWDKTFKGTWWSKTDDGDVSGWWNGGHSVQQTSDDGYIIAGITEGGDYGNKGDLWLIKTDANGDVEG